MPLPDVWQSLCNTLINPAVRDKCDRSATQHKELYPNPLTSVSFVYGDSPYVCPCSDDACMKQFDTKEAAMADCLQHDPDRRGHQVQFMEPYWTADRPQQILFRPHGPLIEIGQSLAVSHLCIIGFRDCAVDKCSWILRYTSLFLPFHDIHIQPVATHIVIRRG